MQDLDQHIGVLKQHGYRQDEALILLMRLQLIKIINAEIRRRNWSQREAAKILKVGQPRIAELSVLATEKFSVEILLKLLQRLGLKASLTIKPGKNYVRPGRIKKVLSRNPKLQARVKAKARASSIANARSNASKATPGTEPKARRITKPKKTPLTQKTI